MPRLKRRKSGEGVEYVTCRLCLRAFKAITVAHLVFKHSFDPDHPILEYKDKFRLKRSKCLDTIDQGRRAFIRHLKATGRRWTRTRVLREIRRLAESRPVPRYVTCPMGSLGVMARVYFGSWVNALRAAGVRHQRISRPTVWSKEAVLRTLRQRHRSGQPVNHGAIARRFPGLRGAARRYFRTWDEVLEAAGIDPAKVRRSREWDRPSILAAIRRFARRTPLGQIAGRDPALVRASAKRFGTWVAAVRAAGFDYPPGRSGWRWTRDSVLEAIQLMDRAGEPLRTPHAQSRHHGLYLAAKREFGSWKKAIVRAGCSYPAPLNRPGFAAPWKWTRQSIIKLIQDRAQRGQPLVTTHLSDSLGGMLAAVWREFGTWRDAVAAAGCLKHLPGRRNWSREELVALLRSIAREKGYVDSRLVGSSRREGYVRPMHSLRKVFGRFSRAREAAGLPPKVLPWTRERVLTEVQRLGRPVRAKEAWRANRFLVAAAREHFGSWENALRAAGFEFHGRWRTWSREKILAGLRELARRGLRLGSKHAVSLTRGLRPAIRREFGSEEAAAQAAGCPEVLPRKPAHWPRRELLEVLRRIHRRHGRVTLQLLLGTKRPERIGLPYAATLAFGSLTRASEVASGAK